MCVQSQSRAGLVTEPWESFVPENGWIVIITGYIDESYDGKDRPDDFTLSCIMCSAEDWKGISRRWRDLFRQVNEDLGHQGRKQISRYKATDCNGSRNEFESWTRPEKLALTLQMSEIFDYSELLLTQVAYSVRLSRIHKKIPSVKDPKAFAYAFLFQQIVRVVLEMLDSLPEESSISFIHDRSDFDLVYLQVFKVLLLNCSEAQRKKLITIAPMANENCPPLEVADLIAYENYKLHLNRSAGKNDKRTIDYLIEKGRLGGKSSIIPDEEFSIPEFHLNVLKWCSSFGGKCLRYPELDERE
jgi:hypothetical protein